MFHVENCPTPVGPNEHAPPTVMKMKPLCLLAVFRQIHQRFRVWSNAKLNQRYLYSQFPSHSSLSNEKLNFSFSLLLVSFCLVVCLFSVSVTLFMASSVAAHVKCQDDTTRQLLFDWQPYNAAGEFITGMVLECLLSTGEQGKRRLVEGVLFKRICFQMSLYHKHAQRKGNVNMQMLLELPIIL